MEYEQICHDNGYIMKFQMNDRVRFKDNLNRQGTVIFPFDYIFETQIIPQALVKWDSGNQYTVTQDSIVPDTNYQIDSIVQYHRNTSLQYKIINIEKIENKTYYVLRQSYNAYGEIPMMKDNLVEDISIYIIINEFIQYRVKGTPLPKWPPATKK